MSSNVYDELDDERDKMRRIDYALPEAAEEVAVQFVDVLSRCTALKEMIISNKTLESSPKTKHMSHAVLFAQKMWLFLDTRINTRCGDVSNVRNVNVDR